MERSTVQLYDRRFLLINMLLSYRIICSGCRKFPVRVPDWVKASSRFCAMTRWAYEMGVSLKSPQTMTDGCREDAISPCNGVCLRGADGGCFRQFMQQQPCAAFHFFRFGSFQYFFVNVFIGLCQFVGLQMVVDKGNRIFIQFEFIQYGTVVAACIVQDTCG